MDNNYLREWDRKMTDYLAGLFDFKPHEHQVYDARDPKNAKVLEMMRGWIDPVDWEHGTKVATMMENERMRYHLVMAADNENHYPLLLAEGVTSGEHNVKHTNPDDPDEYFSRFHLPFRTIVSHIGSRSAYKHLTGEDFDIIPGLDVTSEQRMLNSLGCLAAYQLISGRKEIPYREIFRAENQKDGWDIVNISEPIMMDVDLDNIAPHLQQILVAATMEMNMTPAKLEVTIFDMTPRRPRRWKYRPSDN